MTQSLVYALASDFCIGCHHYGMTLDAIPEDENGEYIIEQRATLRCMFDISHVSLTSFIKTYRPDLFLSS